LFDAAITNSWSHSFGVMRLGEFAHAALTGHSIGYLLAVFRRSFYVRFGGEAVCFGPAGLGNGPVNVLVRMAEEMEWAQFGLAPAQKVASSATEVCVADRLRFDFASAEIWHPPHPPDFTLDDLQAGLSLLSQAARRRSPGGLGVLLGGLDAPELRLSASNDMLLRAAQGPVRDVAEWLWRALRQADELPPRSLQKLVGLGPGLTPSGDDLLGGLLVALHYLGFSPIADELSRAILPLPPEATNIISAQLLRCAARGHASSALFEALDAIMTARDLDQRLDVIHAIGHTSGWDSLAGAALACLAVLRLRAPAAAIASL
jgi:hypothetical protein